MKQNETFHQDEGLIGNEKIEQAILALQQDPTPELLAHALTMVRRRMQENGQLILAVEHLPQMGSFTSRQQKPVMENSGGWHLPVLRKN